MSHIQPPNKKEAHKTKSGGQLAPPPPPPGSRPAARAEGSTLVAMLADTGERYLSTPLFAAISADMNEEEHPQKRAGRETGEQLRPKLGKMGSLSCRPPQKTGYSCDTPY